MVIEANVSQLQGGCSLLVIPSWMEDESLYSWCCRWHRHTLNRTRTTGLTLFGVSSAAKVWYAPNPFEWFDRVTMGLLGSPYSILKNRTVAGSYLALAAPDDRQRVELGELPPAHLFSAKSGGSASLRYCEKCASEHISSHGVAIWRVSHQLPGVVVCVDHAQPLVEYSKIHQIWTLPLSRRAGEICIASQWELELMIAVARAARYIFECEAVDVNVLRNNACKVLCEAYGALDAKRLDPELVEREWSRSALFQWCTRTTTCVKAFPRFWLTDVIRRRRSERNPLRWAFAIAYFSERSWTSIDIFFSNLSVAQTTQLSLWSDMKDIPQEIQYAFERAHSLTEAAAMLRVTAPTVRRWMRTNPDLCGITQHWKFRR